MITLNVGSFTGSDGAGKTIPIHGKNSVPISNSVQVPGIEPFKPYKPLSGRTKADNDRPHGKMPKK